MFQTEKLCKPLYFSLDFHDDMMLFIYTKVILGISAPVLFQMCFPILKPYVI